MTLTKEQKMAYTEVCTVLNHMDKTDVDKIPSDILTYYKDNADKSYNFQLDENKPFNHQNLSYAAKVVLAIFFRDYWATPEQRNKIIQKEKYDLQKQEEEKNKKYNPDLLFSNSNSNNNFGYSSSNNIANLNSDNNEQPQANEQSQALAIIEKEKWYNKIFNSIKRFFKRNSK